MSVHTAAGVVGPRRYRNNEKMLALADPVWQAAADEGLLNLDVEVAGNRLVDTGRGHEFVNLCSCSYLGLNRHPAVIEGAVEALRAEGSTALSVSTTRVRPAMLTRLEDELGDLFGGTALAGLSCSALTSGILPLVASGHLAPDGPRVMVFDKMSHFCMSYVKPVCADESLVLTIDHNDLNQLEDICRKYPSVAYVADGAYSMGGTTALEGLLELQQRYGLFLFFDDSHSLSAVGQRGEGFVRSRIEPNPLTVIVASLHKAFGAKGGVVLLDSPRLRDFLLRHAGAIAWSQNMGMADVGAALASAAIHRSPELGELQRKLRSNVALFDELLPTPFAGDGMNIRFVEVGDADLAVALSAGLYERGFYSSAVFFPIVARGHAGIRIMVRADLAHTQITQFASAVRELTA
ncbi:7-keto-8-aminopelargonate synthetase [Lentzea xinjiangensis]|uniref:8-amino-7-oxononanoate synthase n=1 Tax=Lentzea xinjiangensis TaxID=402600 RepID=A0A1H9SYT1_9PSEU|nr:aminotransferase class I/II-fold pyridoxal phosphate-dependent enzyme [Lentzea xinjiangensis]SER90046.1 7-keto-8-aminopelargonate synthetase [Lentzea xinjiangensis]